MAYPHLSFDTLALDLLSEIPERNTRSLRNTFLLLKDGCSFLIRLCSRRGVTTSDTDDAISGSPILH